MRKSTQSAGGGQPILDGMPEPARVHPVTAALKRAPLVRALEAELVAGPIIADYHHDRWYKQPRIIYLFSEKIPKAGGRDAYATVRKVGGMNAFLYHLLELEASKGSPLVHSDLVECGDKDIQYSLRGHDLEEFTSIVKRHGCWAADIVRFKEVVLET